jgi:hypothetical protein
VAWDFIISDLSEYKYVFRAFLIPWCFRIAVNTHDETLSYTVRAGYVIARVCLLGVNTPCCDFWFGSLRLGLCNGTAMHVFSVQKTFCAAAPSYSEHNGDAISTVLFTYEFRSSTTFRAMSSLELILCLRTNLTLPYWQRS